MIEFVEELLPIERNLFLILNGSDSVFLDNIMWVFSGKLIWLPMILVIICCFFIYTKPKKEVFYSLFFIIILLVLCDQISSHVFKPYFHRFRPTHHPDFETVVDTVNNYRSSLYGFISGHATNSFGIALFLSLLMRSRWITIPLFIWATINSYSRIYLGVHFITDIVAGIIIGLIIAYFVYLLYKNLRSRILGVPALQRGESVYSAKCSKSIGILFSAYLILVVTFAQQLV